MKPYRPFFKASLQRHYPQASEALVSETERHYAHISADTQFAATSSNPIDRRIDFSAYFLALVKALDAHGASFEDIRTVCLEIATAYVQPRSRLQAWLKRLPPKLIGTWVGRWAVGKLKQKFSHKGHPEGFLVEVLTDPRETHGLGYGINILECGICKLYHKHRYDRYAPILCEVDEVTSALAGLELFRTSTIANGATHCDFRWKRA